MFLVAATDNREPQLWQVVKAMSEFYALETKLSSGRPFSFEQLKGKVVLIFNSASSCGYTKQLGEMQNLYEKYKDQGLEILAFPSNQFHQEPASDSEIQEFCQVNFGVTFPVMNKIDVNGANADPVYTYLKSQKKGLLGFAGIKWNFEKFLIDRSGKVTNRWASTTPPNAIEKVIERLLQEQS